MDGILVCSGGCFHVAAASDGTDYLVAWSYRTDATTGYDIYARRVSAAGELVNGSDISVAIAPQSQEHVELTYGGGNYFAAWTNHRNGASSGANRDIYATRITSAGSVLDPNGIPVAQGTNQQADPAVAAAGDQYLVTWTRDDDDIRAARVAAQSGQVEDNPSLVVCDATDQQWKSAVASNGSQFLVAWSDARAGTAPLSTPTASAPTACRSTATDP